MTGQTKLRTAVGVFHDITRLRDAANSLAAIGCSTDDIILVHETGALNSQLDTNFDDHLSSIPRMIRNLEGVATKQTNQQANSAALKRGRVAKFETWLPNRLAGDLDDQLSRGGCLLFCTALSDKQELAITNALLQHSADRVQVHDISETG